MSRVHPGIRREYAARDILEAAGFEVVRAAGSHGLFDLVAWNRTSLRLIQVKLNSATVTGAEREAMLLTPAPGLATKEIWSFVSGNTKPTIEVLN